MMQERGITDIKSLDPPVLSEPAQDEQGELPGTNKLSDKIQH